MRFLLFLLMGVVFFAASGKAVNKPIPYSVEVLCASNLKLLAVTPEARVDLFDLPENSTEIPNRIDTVIKNFYEDLIRVRSQQARNYRFEPAKENKNSFFQEATDGVIWTYNSKLVSTQNISPKEFDPLILKIQNLLSLLTERSKHNADPRYKQMRVMQRQGAVEIDRFFKAENFEEKSKNIASRRKFLSSLVPIALGSGVVYSSYLIAQKVWEIQKKGESEELVSVLNTARENLYPFTFEDMKLYKAEMDRYLIHLGELRDYNRKNFKSVLSDDDLLRLRKTGFDKELVRKYQEYVKSKEAQVIADENKTFREENRLYGPYELTWFQKEVELFEAQNERLREFLFKEWRFNLTEKEIEYLFFNDLTEDSLKTVVAWVRSRYERMNLETLITESQKVRDILQKYKHGIIDHHRIYPSDICSRVTKAEVNLAAAVPTGIISCVLIGGVTQKIHEDFLQPNLEPFLDGLGKVGFRQFFLRLFPNDKKPAMVTIKNIEMDSSSPEYRSSTPTTEYVYLGTHTTGESHMDMLLRLPSSLQTDLEPMLFVITYSSSLAYFDNKIEEVLSAAGYGAFSATPSRRPLTQRFEEVRKRFYDKVPGNLMTHEFHAMLMPIFQFAPTAVTETALQQLIVIEHSVTEPDDLISELTKWKANYIR